MRLEVTLTGTEAIRDQFARLNRAAQFKAMAKTSQELYDYVERESDKHTKPGTTSGALFQSVFQKREGETFIIGNDLQRAPHALFVHDGTRPHEIRGKKMAPRKIVPGKGFKALGGIFRKWYMLDQKMLRFSIGNRFVFARSVKHPGYKGDPWLKRAAAIAPAIFERHVIATLKGK